MPQLDLFNLWIDRIVTPLRVASFRGVERISRPHRFDVVVQTRRSPATGAQSPVGRRAILTLGGESGGAGGAARIVRGVISAWRVEGHPSLEDYFVVRARLVSRLWLLTQRRDTRIFQGLDVVRVVALVLKRYQLALVTRLERKYPPLEYCVQYNETDLAFVERILAEHGIFYWLQPPPGATTEFTAPEASEGTLIAGGTLGAGDVPAEVSAVLSDDDAVVLCDSARPYPALGQPPQLDEELAPSDLATPAPAAALRFAREVASDGHSDSPVTAFALRTAVRPVAVAMRRFDFLQPHVPQDALAESDADDDASVTEAVGAEPLEVYDHADLQNRPEISRRLARVALESERVRALVAEGESLRWELAPALRFALEEHPLAEVNREYVVARVEHAGTTPELGDDDAASAEPVYRNRFTAVPSDRVLRPRRHTRKVQQALETALVVGLGHEEIYTDAHARVKVQFHWDRHGQRNSHSSCWLRVAQGWAGPGRGAQFIPRVGDEVLVAFLEGDTDRPVVVGSLYNGAAPAPFALPEEKTRSGWRTRSTPDAEGYSELSFEDTVGRERVHLRAQRDLDVHVHGEHTREVGGSEGIHVAGSQRVTVDSDRVDHVRGNETRTVDCDRTQTVLGNDYTTVSLNARRRVNGQSTEVVANEASVRVGTSRSTHVGTLDTLEAVMGTRKITAMDQYDAGSFIVVSSLGMMHAKETQQITSDGAISISAAASITLQVGGSIVRIDGDGVSVNGTKVALAGDGATLNLGDSTAALEGGTTKLIGDDTTMQGSGASVVLGSSATVQGSAVNLKSGSASDDDDSGSSQTTDIELVDQDGNALAHEYYEIVLSDGKRQVGVLDAEGKATVKLDGDAHIVFPRLAVIEKD